MRARLFAGTLALAALLITGCGLCVETIPSGIIPDKTEKDHMTAIDGVRYHYTEYAGPGKNVVLIHGFAASTYTWEECAKLLQKEGFHVWALDMKGFGWSDKPRGASYDPFVLMEETRAWMQALSISGATVVGNSLGGAVAWAMAVKHPEAVEKLVLIDSAGYDIRKPWIIALAKAPFAAEVTRLFFGKWLVRMILGEVLYDDSLITEDQVGAYFDRQRTERGIYAQIQVARALDYKNFEPLVKRIPEIRCPTLIIWGNDDRWIPLENAARFNRDIADSQLAIVPECGHIPMEEKPVVAAGLIADFIRGRPVDSAYAR
jgi:pimeloyl-ACP methyl ester carboxylesterase